MKNQLVKTVTIFNILVGLFHVASIIIFIGLTTRVEHVICNLVARSNKSQVVV